MPKIKLKEWADRHNLSYITANRHFHAGLIPGAVQLDSGTILVEDDSLEQNMAGNASTNDAMSLFLKKTVEFSKNNSTVEDFAAYIISNFRLQLNNVPEGSPRYSKNRPKPEDVQKHFQQFLPDKEAQERLKEVKNLIKEGKPAGEVIPAGMSEQATELSEVLGNAPPFERVNEPTNDLSGEFGFMLSEAAAGLSTPPTEGLVTRSVDFNTTPQQINYTGSTSQTFGSGVASANLAYTAANSLAFNDGRTGTFVQAAIDAYAPSNVGGVYFNSSVPASAGALFQPTQKELLSAVKVIETAETEDLPRKRGRKPLKKR
jgi:hypothetical protein